MVLNALIIKKNYFFFYSRLTNNQLEKEKAELVHQMNASKNERDTSTSEGPAAGNNFQYLKIIILVYLGSETA